MTKNYIQVDNFAILLFFQNIKLNIALYQLTGSTIDYTKKQQHRNCHYGQNRFLKHVKWNYDNSDGYNKTLTIKSALYLQIIFWNYGVMGQYTKKLIPSIYNCSMIYLQLKWKNIDDMLYLRLFDRGVVSITHWTDVQVSFPFLVPLLEELFHQQGYPLLVLPERLGRVTQVSTVHQVL